MTVQVWSYRGHYVSITGGYSSASSRFYKNWGQVPRRCALHVDDIAAHPPWPGFPGPAPADWSPDIRVCWPRCWPADWPIPFVLDEDDDPWSAQAQGYEYVPTDPAR